MFEIVMPKAGMAMEEGTLIRWIKKEGEEVKKGEAIAEIETDKVIIEEEAPGDGVMLKTLVDEGAVVPVVQPIAYIGQPGEEIPEAPAAAAKAEAPKEETAAPAKPEQPAAAAEAAQPAAQPTAVPQGDVRATPLARRLAKEAGIDIAVVPREAETNAVYAAQVEAAKTSATPLAKRTAANAGVDIGAATGSGYMGKVMQTDVLALVGAKQALPVREEKTVKISGMRKVIAQRMSQANVEVPPVTLTAEADVTDLMALRKSVNDIEGIKVSVNDMVLKAAAIALAQMPDINVHTDGENIYYKRDINIGMAVGVENGLMVPVIPNADNKHLFEIAQEAKQIGEDARSGSLALDKLSGGTFTVTNVGMFGIKNFTPIINQPEVAILGVCAIEDKMALAGGNVVMRKTMNLCLTHDHRILDGVIAAQFVGLIKSVLESPAQLLL